MAAIGTKLVKLHNDIGQTFFNSMPSKIQPYLESSKLWCIQESDSKTLKAIKLLASFAFSSVAAYFCPAAGVAKYAIKAVVWCAAYTLSFPVLGSFMKRNAPVDTTQLSVANAVAGTGTSGGGINTPPVSNV